jgi:hypothetical protein
MRFIFRYRYAAHYKRALMPRRAWGLSIVLTGKGNVFGRQQNNLVVFAVTGG